MLSNRGYSIIEAGSAPEAIQAAASHSGTIDLLITDVVMPRTNCDQLVHDLQAARPNLKCILISGYPQDMLSEHGLAGARPDFMQKPFTAEQLVAKIREVLGIQVRRCGGESA
jgi:two-component system cell cycle sensor histidine kinase/response regulator CckA